MIPILTVRDHADVHVLLAGLAVLGEYITDCPPEDASTADLQYMVSTTKRIIALVAALRLECAMQENEHTFPDEFFNGNTFLDVTSQK